MAVGETLPMETTVCIVKKSRKHEHETDLPLPSPNPTLSNIRHPPRPSNPAEKTPATTANNSQQNAHTYMWMKNML